jgi:hypothetical protein
MRLPVSRLAAFGFAIFSFTAPAQRLVNTGPLPAPINAPRYGNILFPGGVYPSNHITNLGRSISGNPIRGGQFGPIVGPLPDYGRGRGRTVVVPIGVPIGYPVGYYGQPEPNIMVVVPQQPAPSVIINQSFTPQTANPVLRDYSDSDLPETPRSDVRVYEVPVAPRAEGRPLPKEVRKVDETATIYMIALKDETIRQAVGYWLEGDTLHYITPGGTINRVSLDQVDREASERYNRERNVEFSLRR